MTRAAGGVAAGMAFHRMSDTEVRELLDADPPHTAKVVTLRAGGGPHVAPIWFALDGDTVVFNTGADTLKGRNLARDPRMALCVDLETPPFAYVSIEGTAEISDDLDEVRRWATVIGGRYMGADRAEAFGRRNGVPGELLVRLRADRVIAFADLAD